MKKLTNTQIKALMNTKTETIKVLPENEELCFSFEVKKYLLSGELDKIISCVDSMVFINEEYCPQYTEMAKEIAWLSVCTNIPLYYRNIKVNGELKDGKQTTVEVIDYDKTGMLAHLIIDYVTSHSCLNVCKQYCHICAFVDEYIKYKTNIEVNGIYTRINGLVNSLEEKYQVINDISDSLTEIYNNPELIGEIRNTTQETQKLNDTINTGMSEKFLKLIKDNKE